MIDYKSLKVITPDEEEKTVKRLCKEFNKSGDYKGRFYFSGVDSMLDIIGNIVYEVSDKIHPCAGVPDYSYRESPPKYEKRIRDLLELLAARSNEISKELINAKKQEADALTNSTGYIHKVLVNQSYPYDIHVIKTGKRIDAYGKFKAKDRATGIFVEGYYLRITVPDGPDLCTINNGLRGQACRSWMIDPDTLEQLW